VTSDPAYTDYRYAYRNGWRWVWWDLRDGHVVAALRHAFWTYARGYVSETCERCGRPYFLWHTDDALYSEVTGHPLRDDGEAPRGLYCPTCFDNAADRLGIVLKWRPEVLKREARAALADVAGEVEG